MSDPLAWGVLILWFVGGIAAMILDPRMIESHDSMGWPRGGIDLTSALIVMAAAPVIWAFWLIVLAVLGIAQLVRKT